MAVKEAAKKSPLDTNRAIAGFYFHRLLCRVFSDPDSPFVLKGGQSALARNLPERFQIPDAWPAVYGKPYAKMARQAKVNDVAPDMVSVEDLAAKLYEPALGTHWEHGASTWSPSSLTGLQQKETTPWSQTTAFPIAPRHKAAEASQAHAKRLFLIKQMHL